MAEENTTVAGGMQDDIKAAISSLESSQAPSQVPAQGAPGPAAAPATPGAPAGGGELYGKPPEPVKPAKPAAEAPGLRGEVPAAPAAAAPAKPEVKPAVPPAPKVEGDAKFVSRLARPPASWKPENIQHWDAIPEPVRVEIHRREAEMFRALQSSKEARDFVDEFNQVTAPYAVMIAQEGPPMKAFQNYLQTVTTLRMGTPWEKAYGIAQACRNFNVPIELLDQALAGNLPPGANVLGNGQQGQQQFRDPRVDQLFTQLQQQNEQRQQRMNEEIDAELADFENNPEYPYFDHVRTMMGDVLELAARRNEKMSLQEAYRRSIMTHPELSKLAQQQEMAAAAKAAKEAANVSVTGAPVTPSAIPVTSSTGSVRGDIEQAIAQLSGR